MKNMKRIHKVVIKRMVDESPDTSWLGEYGSRAESEYAIDRRHKPECSSLEHNHRAAVDQLERILQYLNRIECSDDLAEACDIVVEAQESLAECDCGGVWTERHSYEYFNPNHENYKDLPDDEIRKYCLQDYERIEAYNNQDWCFIGIRAEAEIGFPYMTEGRGGRTYYKTEPITSGGLWGLESDSGADYFKEVESDELHELREELKAIGFSSRAISAAFKNVERTGE